jgi:hypothetical protein
LPAATSTAPDRGPADGSAPTSNRSPTPRRAARRLAAAEPPDKVARLTPPNRLVTVTTRRRRPTNRPALTSSSAAPARLHHRRRQPAPRAHRTGRGRPAPRRLHRPASATSASTRRSPAT